MYKSTKISLLIALLALFSCEPQNRTASSRIDHAEAISDSLPQLALAMLDSLEEESRTYPEALRMRYELVRGEAQNRACVDFTTDSVMKVVAEYYDKHGDPNTRAKAHYILGCVYRDMHEAPLAAGSYVDAIEAADTLSGNCDYGLLMLAWEQMANVYSLQVMPQHELEALRQTRKYAKLSNNTYNYINAIEKMVHAYATLEEQDSILYVTNLAQRLYRQNGYHAAAAAACPMAILVHLQRREYDRARELMDLFENESGLFDCEGNAATGYENYYYSQGLYYLGVGQTDSAKERFLKLAKTGRYQYDAYKGLLLVAQAKNETDIDSVIYLAEKHGNGLDSLYSTIHANALANAETLYNYKRNARLAQVKTEEARSYKLRLLMLLLFVIVASATAFGIGYVFRRRRRREIERLHNTLTSLKSEYTARISDLQAMEDDYLSFKEKKKQELAMLNERIKLHTTSLGTKTATSAILNIESLLKDKMTPTPGFQPSISEAEWQSIYSVLLQHVPDAYDTIVKHPQLSQQEIHVAVLTLLGFGTNDTALLLASTKNRISNAKASVNKKLFGDATSRTLFINLSKTPTEQILA